MMGALLHRIDAGSAVYTASATRQGTDDPNCDCAAVYTSETGRAAGAVIDGTGHSGTIAEIMRAVATVATRVGAQRGALAGLMSAAELVTDRGPDAYGPTGVGVLAVSFYDAVDVAWIGDARAYGWDGRTLTLYTTDHTLGEQLRRNGAPWEVAEQHDNWSVTTLCYATIATIRQVQIPAGHTIILTSDGVHASVEHDRLAEIVRKHAHDPQALADALVAAPDTDEDGIRDDATALVLETRAA
jgi:serine/threonine protein phosphatase PrpC